MLASSDIAAEELSLESDAPGVLDLLRAHDWISKRVRTYGARMFLLSRRWRRTASGAWVRPHGRTAYSTGRALKAELASSLRGQLAARGWWTLPDGSTLRHPTCAGMIQAARVDRMLAGCATEVEA